MEFELDEVDPSATTIERLNQNPELMEAMLSMSERANEQMVEDRRRKVFSMFWEHTSMTRKSVLENVEAQENHFIEIYEDDAEGLPEWMVRMEAQDVLMGELAEELDVA